MSTPFVLVLHPVFLLFGRKLEEADRRGRFDDESL